LDVLNQQVLPQQRRSASSDELGAVDRGDLQRGEPQRLAPGSSLHSEEIENVAEGDPGEKCEHQHCACGDQPSLNTASANFSKQTTQHECGYATTVKRRDWEQIQNGKIC
jgi:hypothetical protein